MLVQCNLLCYYRISRNTEAFLLRRFPKPVIIASTVITFIGIGLIVLRGSNLAKAVQYALNQKPYMENYLLDGRCSLSNNAAENAIRPFVTGRKNWLFADTPKGASASAAIYSIIETAKANGLDLYKYLQLILMYMPDWDNSEEYLEDLMPWSEFARSQCGR